MVHYDTLSRMIFSDNQEAELARLSEAYEYVPDASSFDPELLYIECRFCGKPLVWTAGKTTSVLLSAGIEIETLDACCMILSDGCPHCEPELFDKFPLSVVRIVGLTAEEAAYMLLPGGNA